MVFTIAARADVAETKDFKALQDRWANFLFCYRKQDWTGALKASGDCRHDCERFGLVGLIDAYEARIRHLEQNPPAPDWDGVFTAETK